MGTAAGVDGAFAIAWTVTHAPSVASDNLRTLHASRPPTSSSPWGAATPARSSPESGTRTGNCPTPLAQSVDAVRPIRDDIEERVRRLLDELGITPIA